MDLNLYLKDVIKEFEQMKYLADKAFAQVSDKYFFVTLDKNSNSIAIIIKHMTGNMKSRWTDFLTTDGEKDFRKRDTEFERYETDTRETLMKRWEDGWKLVFDTVSSLTPDDLGRTITIRNNQAYAFQAIHRQMTHYSEHIGQIIMLAKHFAKDNWQTLSIPKGKSEEFNMLKKDSFQNKKLK